MKHMKLLTIIAICLLVTGAFAVIPAFSAQPPVDTTTYYVGTIGQPARLDPGRAYDTASAELLQNVYQTLIWFNSKHPLTLTSGADYNMTPADHSDLTTTGFGPVIATDMPTITPSGVGNGQLWNFHINTNAMFQNWTSPTNGGVLNDMPKRHVTTDDVVYSFQVQMVEDSPYAPVWMWETAAFNQMSFDALFPETEGFDPSVPAQEAQVASMIQSWCYKDPAHPDTNVIFNFSYPLPQAAMDQIFAQTWGDIVNKDFWIAHGMWNYSWTPGWASVYHRAADGAGNRTPIDRYYAGVSLYSASTPRVGYDVPDCCGTGPYKYEYGGWNQVTKVWTLNADPTYWMGWANAGDKHGNYIHTIIERGVDTWPTRKMLFLDGEFDGAVVPRANMYDLLVDKYTPLAGLTLVTQISGLVNEEIFFTFNVSSGSAYQSYVGYPNHIETSPTFFNNINMRLAFAYAVNYTAIINDAWFGEALPQASWWVDGLVPASSKNTSLSVRAIDLDKVKSLLQATTIDGNNIWQTGFETTAVYNTGNDQRMIELQSVAAAFASLGTKFKVNVIGLDWPIFLDQALGIPSSTPVFCIGWLADYADPSDWASPYQQSSGSFLIGQITMPTAAPADQAAVDAEIIKAATDTNMAERDQLYQDLQYKYWLDVPSIPVVQPIGRRFARDWVQGWYYNDLYPGLYWYDLYKTPYSTAGATSVTLDVTHTIVAATTYPKVFLSMGTMKVPFGGGTLAKMTFTVTVWRDDSGGFMPAIVSLERNNLTALTDFRKRNMALPNPYTMIGVPWPNGGWFFVAGLNGYYLLGAQGDVLQNATLIGTTGSTSQTVTLTWYEDGVTSTLPANATWSMGARAGIPSTAANPATGVWFNQTDTSLLTTMLDPSKYNYTSLTSTVEINPPISASYTYMKYVLLTGDINGDGRVDILDAILLSGAFGKNFGDKGFNPACDLNGDGTINILDAILLANHFNQFFSFLS